VRLWSLHPDILDCKGLVALWREGLLAQAVLAGKTRGYTNHPQLDRFKPLGLAAIGCYLNHIYVEACKRGYSFDNSKILVACQDIKIPVTDGQLGYEFEHLKRKIAVRSPMNMPVAFSVHPIFEIVRGEIESWERV
jgi:pyrimidine dimer DNA glycosylase